MLLIGVLLSSPSLRSYSPCFAPQVPAQRTMGNWRNAVPVLCQAVLMSVSWPCCSYYTGEPKNRLRGVWHYFGQFGLMITTAVAAVNLLIN